MTNTSQVSPNDESQPRRVRRYIDFELLAQLATKPHPLLNIWDDFAAQLDEGPIEWTREVFQEARTAHHLLDLAGIPAVQGYASDLDARVYIAIQRIQQLDARLARIASWHRRVTSPGGVTHDECSECGWTWPCPTWRQAEPRGIVDAEPDDDVDD